MKSERISRKDVAALANVSETTVSVVLGGISKIVIAPETRERVLRAAELLGYHPHY